MSNDILSDIERIKLRLRVAIVTEVAKALYSNYCEKVGGKAYNGDPLPDWETFSADTNKKVQVDAWISNADMVLTMMNNLNHPSPGSVLGELLHCLQRARNLEATFQSRQGVLAPFGLIPSEE